MSGETKYLLDTNAVIALINGNKQLLEITKAASFVGLSVISVIEFLSFSKLSERDRILFEEFSQETELFNLSANDTVLIREITSIRNNYKLKLPDAILAATAVVNNCQLITTDLGFKKVPSLSILSY